MIFVRPINKNEKQILKQHYANSGCRLIRERAHAVILSNQGWSVPDIAAILLRNNDTICLWLNNFSQRGISSIFHKYEDNDNAGKLTKEQREEVEEVLKNPPSEYGLPKEFWDLPALKNYLQAEFGIVYESERSYHYLLKFGGLSFKLPAPFDIKRDKDRINAKLAEIRQELRKYAADGSWEIFAADEARITWEAEIRRAWLKRNEKTIIKVHRDNQYQNYFGALDLKRGKSFIAKLSWQDTDEIIKALRELSHSYPEKKICLVWDNARWHKAKKLREELRKGQSLERVHLINFPPYAPDVNPQEHVWKFGKDCLGNETIDSFAQTILLFEKSVKRKKFNYKIPEFVLR